MNLKAKGISAERELIHKFWDNGWSAIRVAASGAIKYPCPDIVAGNNLRKIAVECKVTNDVRQYLTKREVDELCEFSRIFGAEPWIAVKFNRVDWYFLTIDDLEDSGKNYGISIPSAKRKGFSFSEMIKN